MSHTLLQPVIKGNEIIMPHAPVKPNNAARPKPAPASSKR